MSDYENCPICNQTFPLEVLINHASNCNGKPVQTATYVEDSMDVDDEDYKLALQLQAEEQKHRDNSSVKKRNNQAVSDEEYARQLYEQEKKSAKPSAVKCQKCSSETDMDDLYILDECTHRFCKPCLKEYVADKIQTSVAVECPLKDCKIVLSVRDMKDLLPQIQKHSFMNPTKGSSKATERIMAELKHIMKSDPEKNGYSVKPVEDNLYKWELKFFNFDKTDPLGQDMANMRINSILIHVTFPPSYPFAPPYIRVIKPRFQYRTGHVTIGGSICMEILTNKGWSPANTLEAIIVSIRAQLIAGGARLDPHNKTEYTEAEAKDAFDRMVRDHGWH